MMEETTKTQTKALLHPADICWVIFMVSQYKIYSGSHANQRQVKLCVYML